jgi:hypothetical protein
MQQLTCQLYLIFVWGSLETLKISMELAAAITVFLPANPLNGVRPMKTHILTFRSLSKLSTTFVWLLLWACPLLASSSETDLCARALSAKPATSSEASSFEGSLGPLMNELVQLITLSLNTESEFQRVVSSNLLTQKRQELQALLGTELANLVLQEIQRRVVRLAVTRSTGEIEFDLSRVPMRPEPEVPEDKQPLSKHAATMKRLRTIGFEFVILGLLSIASVNIRNFVEDRGLADSNLPRMSSHPSARHFSLQEKAEAKANELLKDWEGLDREGLRQQLGPYREYVPDEVIDWLVERLAMKAKQP